MDKKETRIFLKGRGRQEAGKSGKLNRDAWSERERKSAGRKGGLRNETREKRDGRSPRVVVTEGALFLSHPLLLEARGFRREMDRERERERGREGGKRGREGGGGG